MLIQNFNFFTNYKFNFPKKIQTLQFKNNLTCDAVSFTKKILTGEQKDEIIKRYRQGKAPKQIGDKFNITEYYVNKVVNNHPDRDVIIEEHKRNYKDPRNFTPDEIEQIYYKHVVDKITVEQLAKEYHCRKKKISNALKKYAQAHGILYEAKRQSSFTDKEVAKMFEMSQEGKSIPEIAEKHYCCGLTVQILLAKYKKEHHYKEQCEECGVNPNCKFGIQIQLDIYRKYKEEHIAPYQIAKDYNCSPKTIRSIIVYIDEHKQDCA